MSIIILGYIRINLFKERKEKKIIVNIDLINQ